MKKIELEHSLTGVIPKTVDAAFRVLARNEKSVVVRIAEELRRAHGSQSDGVDKLVAKLVASEDPRTIADCLVALGERVHAVAVKHRSDGIEVARKVEANVLEIVAQDRADARARREAEKAQQAADATAAERQKAADEALAAKKAADLKAAEERQASLKAQQDADAKERRAKEKADKAKADKAAADKAKGAPGAPAGDAPPPPAT